MWWTYLFSLLAATAMGGEFSGEVLLQKFTPSNTTWHTNADAKAELAEHVKNATEKMSGDPNVVCNFTFVVNGRDQVEAPFKCVSPTLNLTAVKSIHLAFKLRVEEGVDRVNQVIKDDGRNKVGLVISMSLDPIKAEAFGIAPSPAPNDRAEVRGEVMMTTSRATDTKDLIALETAMFNSLCKILGLGEQASCATKLTVDVFVKGAGGEWTAGRRLVEQSVKVDYTVSDLPLARAEAVSAKMTSGDSAAVIIETMNEDPITAGLVNEGSIKASASKSAGYTPVEYVVSGYTKDMHAWPRLVGGRNTFPISNGTLMGDEETMNYVTGLVSAGVFFLILAVFNIVCMPYCYCCCCKKQKGSPTGKFNLNTIVALACLALGIIGCAVADQGNQAMQASVDDFIVSLEMVDDTVVRINQGLLGVNESVTDCQAAFAGGPSGCSATDALAPAFDIEIPESPVTLELKEIIDNVKMARGNQSMGSQAAYGVVFLFIVLYCMFTLQVKLGVLSGLNGFRVCCGASVLPGCSVILLVVLWIFCAVNAILAVLIGDLCISDPIAMISGLMGTSVQGLGYMLTCEGEPMKSFDAVYSIHNSLLDTQDNLEGLPGLIKLAGGNCSTVDTTPITSCIDAAVTHVDDIVDVLRCKTINQILVKILYSGVCDNMQTGTVNVWVGLSILGFVLMTCMFNYIKVSRGRAAVAPEEANRFAAIESDK